MPIAAVSPSSYECTLTVDCAIFGFQDNTLKLLLIKRAVEPFKDEWLLPGGSMKEDNSLEETVDQVLFDLTGIHNIHHEQVKCYSKVHRHPVKRVVTLCFYALIKPENHQIKAKNYVSEVSWFTLDKLPKLAIDHSKLVKDALHTLRQNLSRTIILGELLPSKFTLKELQNLYEGIMAEKLDRRNFRKRIFQLNRLKATGQIKKGVKGGPELYELKPIHQ